jgi:hypothetical protein
MRLTRMNASWRVTGALVLAALVCAALAGCGSIVSGAEGGGLCGQQSLVTRLVVVKRGPIIARRHLAPPATITVSDPAEARSVADAACALPAMPPGAAACPMDTGLIYRLVFSAGGTKLAPVTADRTGCEGMRGLGQVRSTARSPGFWQVLRNAERKIRVAGAAASRHTPVRGIVSGAFTAMGGPVPVRGHLVQVAPLPGRTLHQVSGETCVRALAVQASGRA